MSWEEVLGGLVPALLGLLPFLVAYVVVTVQERREEARRRPLTPAEQYRVMQIRKRDTMRQLRAVARDANENRGERT